MELNHLKIAIRILWKNKAFSFINILGLSVGLAGFMLILLYFNYETSFEKWNPLSGHIYRIDQQKEDTRAFSEYTPYPLAAYIKESCPEVDRTCILYPAKIDLPLYWGEQSYLFKNIYGVDSNFLKLFPYKLKYGSAEFRPGSLVLTEETSRKIFGNIDPVGKTLFIGRDQHAKIQPSFTITGVIEDPAGPSHLNFEAISWLPANSIPQAGWQRPNVVTYVLLKPNGNISELAKKIRDIYKLEQGRRPPDILPEPITSIHLHSTTSADNELKTLTIISALAILVLLIACINFTNLSIARSVTRAKEAGIRKVLGSGRVKLFLQFLMENFIQCLASLFLSLILVELFLPIFNRIIGLQLGFGKYGNLFHLFRQITAVLAGITVVAGAYPAFFLANYEPARVLKGNFARSEKGKLVRNVLLIIQFVIATVFIMSQLTINLQIRFMRTKNLGFNPHQVIAVKTFKTYIEPFYIQRDREKLLAIPQVEYVAVSNNIPGERNTSMAWCSYDGDSTFLNLTDVSFDYFETLNIKIKAGRGFTSGFPGDTANGVLLNETAVKRMGMHDPVGKIVYGNGSSFRVTGVVEDYFNRGFEEPIAPTAYLMNDPFGNNWKVNMLIRVNTKNIGRTIARLRSAWAALNPADPVFRYSFLDKDYDRLFASYERLRSLFLIATVLTILIAMTGLLSLSEFMARQRTKEIGIRKVMGASRIAILQLFNRDFLLLIIIANVIAWPISYLIAQNWLNNFAYRTNIPVLLFLVSTILALIMTVLTISFTAWRTAGANPVHSLRYE